MSTLWHFCALAVWLLLGAVLVSIWVTTLSYYHRNVPLYIICGAALLAVFFFAEGLELAFTDLRDKDIEQVDPELQRLLREMKSHEHLFYETREWLVVILVVTATVCASFDGICIPYLGGPFKNFILVLGFTLSFTTFPIVWIAQSWPKQLATRNSESFLRLLPSRFVWTFIGLLGRVLHGLGLFIPSEVLVGLAARSRAFRKGRNLPPSEVAFFISSLKRYGYALCCFEVALEVHGDGGCQIGENAVVYVVAGPKDEFTPYFSFGKSYTRAEITEVKAYAVPRIGETMDGEFSRLFKVLQDGGQAPAAVEIPTPGYQRTITPEDEGKALRFSIRSPYPLPGGAHLPNGEAAEAVALSWRLLAAYSAGTFTAHILRDRDHFYKEFTYPMARYQFTIDLDGEIQGEFAEVEASVMFRGSKHALETVRLGTAIKIDGKRLVGDLHYPLAGARYEVSWAVWETVVGPVKLATGAAAAAAEHR